jgi:hypothetical protein
MVEKSGSLLLDSLGEMVEQVYHFKDHYFEDHDLEEAAAKSDKAIWLRPIFLNSLKSFFFFFFCTYKNQFFAPPENLFFALTKIYFVPNKKIFSLIKFFCTSLKYFFLPHKHFLHS